MKYILGLLSLLCGSIGLLLFGRKKGIEETNLKVENERLKQDAIITEFKKEIHHETHDSDLGDLIASNNSKYGSGPK